MPSWLAYSLLSAADLLTTYLLVGGERPFTHEANPVAAAVLARWGWPGMAVFKVIGVGTVAACAALIARQRPAAAWWLWAFACATTAGVVAWNCGLLISWWLSCQ